MRREGMGANRSVRARARRIFAPPRHPGEAVLGTVLLVCWLAVAGYGVFIAARVYYPDANIIFIWFNAYTFWAYLPVYPLALFAVACRRWYLLTALGAVAFFHLAWVLPDYRPAEGVPAAARQAPTLRVMTINVFFENKDYTGITAEILEENPDVLLVQEFGPRVHLAFEDSGIEARYPYRQIGYEGPFFGNATYSKFPLTAPAVLQAGTRPLIRVTVDVAGEAVTLYNVHPPSPGLSMRAAGAWNTDWQAIIALLRADPGLKVVAGDFNLDQHHHWYRELKELGLVSSHEERGRGNATTWPKGRKLRPIRIDHIFHGAGIVTLDVREGEGAGSDHRPVITTLAIVGD